MNVFVVIPHWNGPDKLLSCLNALKKQTMQHTVVVVDNGSTDDSTAQVREKFPDVTLIELPENTGFTGGVNTGIALAMSEEADAVALLNNDALPEPDWLKELVKTLKKHADAGIATGLFMQSDKKHVDSTGDIYTTWGLPYPRNRDDTKKSAPQQPEYVFGATGGASLYKSELLKDIGTFDNTFFAYLEDVDISWRAQLAGWRVVYTPKAVAYHQIGGTSSSIRGFGTYHYMKNLPMLFWRNVPLRFVPHIFPRLFLAYWTIIFKSFLTGLWPYTLKGQVVFLWNMPHTFVSRWKIQRSKKVSNDYIWSILTHDLPPNAANLRKLRSFFTLKRR